MNSSNVNGGNNVEAGEECGGGANNPPGAAARIRALDQISASSIRNMQVITGVSDVVRELVENAVDAGGTSIQVLLNKHGLEKIEVRDNGHGIPAEDVKMVFQGGHTSKLKNLENLSRGEYFGFKGEALRALCAAGDVSVATKTATEPTARMYKLNALGRVTSQSNGSRSGGTSITVEKLFEAIRVRRQRLESKATTELKEIETYMKGVGLANPKCHLGFYHNSSLVWAKASVNTIEQALITVLGHNIAKRMEKCGPIRVNINEGGSQSENDNGLDRSIELYLPKKPVDMRLMSYTSNKLALIFCNRKRVYIREFEKLIHKYSTSTVVKPQPADQRRFPVSILCLNVPPTEADFNREMDKSKVFLVHKDKIFKALEEALITFYGVDLRICEEKEKAKSETTSTSTTNELSDDMPFEVSLHPPEKNSEISETAKSVPILSSPSFERHGVIGSFLQDIPRSSKAFSESPSKDATKAVVPISIDFPASRRVFHIETTTSGRTEDKTDSSEPKSDFQIPDRPQSRRVSNFVISLASQTLDDSILVSQNQGEKPHEVIERITDEPTLPDFGTLKRGMQKVSANKYQDWLEGRILDENGDVIQNVITVNNPPVANTLGNDIFTGSRPKTSCQAVYSANPPPPKRQKLLDEVFPRQSFSSPAIGSPAVIPSSRFPMIPVASSTPLISSHRQQTLDSFTNRNYPNTPGTLPEIRVPLTPLAPTTPTSNARIFNEVNTTASRVPLAATCGGLERQRADLGRQSLQQLQNRKEAVAVTRKSWGDIDWPPYKDYCYNMAKFKLTPGIIGKIQGPSNLGPLHLVRTEGGIAVFSPQNMPDNLGSEGSESSSSVFENSFEDSELNDQENEAGSPSYSSSDVSTLLSNYLARQSLQQNSPSPTPTVFKMLRTSAQLAEDLQKSLNPRKMF